MKIENIKIEKLKPYERNAKEHNAKQIKLVADSIKKFGWKQPLVISKDFEIVVGHARYEASKLLGLKEVPIIKADDLTEQEIKAYRLADNQINALTGFKMDLVIEELKGLDSEMVDLTGFDRDLLIEGNENDDVIPENPPAKAKRGDIWQLGRHRVGCLDATNIEDVEKLMDGKKADMVFCDPPYGVNYSERARNIVNQRKDGLTIRNDDLSFNELKIFVLEAFKNIAESLKNGGVYYICSPQGGGLGMMMMMMMEAGIECRHSIIWRKDSPVFSMGRLDYDYQHEPILYGWRGSHKHFGNGKFRTSVWDIAKPRNSKLHPTQKPIELIDNAILNSSKEEDIVLDLFLGSGSTLIACEKTNRICYGMEIDEHYCDVIIKRYEDYTGNKPIKIA